MGLAPDRALLPGRAPEWEVWGCWPTCVAGVAHGGARGREIWFELFVEILGGRVRR